jgi:hypothetical protein
MVPLSFVSRVGLSLTEADNNNNNNKNFSPVF